MARRRVCCFLALDCLLFVLLLIVQTSSRGEFLASFLLLHGEFLVFFLFPNANNAKQQDFSRALGNATPVTEKKTDRPGACLLYTSDAADE